jgi:hypothetical protein
MKRLLASLFVERLPERPTSKAGFIHDSEGASAV